MKCPYCGAKDSKVLDSRQGEDQVRRRRECISCHRRFTTHETVEHEPLVVVKKNGSREMFDRSKILSSMLKACSKRPISYETLNAAVSSIENALNNEIEREIPSTRIGELVMNSLRELDDVAYVRFASVYRQFKDTESFMAELRSILEKKEKKQ